MSLAMSSSTSTSIKVEGYRRRIDVTDEIRHILNDYPMGSGIVRELLQNSDDAGASKQILVLDRRTFGTSSLIDPILGRYQGPALLAFNDSEFTESDWESLMTISNSNKRDDISKAGKFGLGFNVVHHITDLPSIISGRKFVLIDPHEDIEQHPGGCQLDFTEECTKLFDQLSAFTSLSTNFSSPFDGTIIRLPLRTDADALRSRIKQEETTVAEIRSLMDSFIKDELDIALIFLKHLKEIEFLEILENGERRFLGRAKLLDVSESRRWTKSDDIKTFHSYHLRIQVATTERNETDNWLVRHELEDSDSVASKLTRTSKRANMLKEEKLYPHVAIALPLSRTVVGRLFTSLPLPIETCFPVHVNALFALTADRQSLRNPNEKAEPDSREAILQLWNKYLFEELIPCAWAHALVDARTHPCGIYSFWAPVSEAPGYWKNIDVKVLKHVVESRLPIWPLHPPDVFPIRFSQLDDALVDMSNTDSDLLSAISQAGVHVIRPLPKILQSIKAAGLDSVNNREITPVTVSKNLKKPEVLPNVATLPTTQKIHLLLYFLQAKAWDQLFTLPIVPRIDGSFVALENPSPVGPSVIFASEMEVTLFRSLDVRFFDRSLVETIVAHPFDLSWDFPKNFVSRTDAKYLGLEHGCHLAIDQKSVEWLSSVHQWANSCLLNLLQDRSIDSLPLPLLDGSTRPTQSQPPSPPILQSSQFLPAERQMFRELDIPLLHKDFKSTRYLDKMLRVSTASNHRESLLQWLELRSAQITSPSFAFHDTLHHVLARALCVGPRLNARWRGVLQDLPVFSAYVSGASQRPAKQYVPFGESHFYIVDKSPEVLPFIQRHTFLDIAQESNAQLINAIDPKALPGSQLELAQVAAEHLHSQPEHLVDPIFEELIVPHIFILSRNNRSTFEALRKTAFVTTRNGRRPPLFLLDPLQVELCGLFTDEEAKLPTGLYAESHILVQLRSVSFFINSISTEMIEERISSYAQGRNLLQMQKCAGKLVDMLETLLIEPDFPRSISQQPWLPTGPAEDLVLPSVCRDESAKFFVSRVFHIMPRNLRNSRLREALGWEADLPFSILHRQFDILVNENQSPDRDQVKTLNVLVPKLAEQLAEDEIRDLRATAGDKAWIPVNDSLRSNRTVFLSHCTLNLEPHFIRLPKSLRQFSDFFSRMGVSNLPSPEEIVQVLLSLSRVSCSASRTDVSIRLLEAISTTKLTKELRESIVAPDIHGKLLNLSDLIFDDLGPKESYSRVSGHWIHRRVSDEVATLLGVKRASTILVDRIADDNAFSDYEQHESLQNKIRQTLLGYKYMSTCNEILANADDAKATKVSIMYDGRTFPNTGALSPALHDVHSGPALVAYNNACFTENDWDGLSKLAVGGKGDRETIGRFGLGALTFYHWTDVPLIVSGDVALFLDPSGVHLPVTVTGQKRRGLKINLRVCDDDGRFDGTFEPLVGLFGFSLREFYNGTLIRLPLRRSESKLLSPTYESPDVGKFLAHCIDVARMAFLFTRCLQSIIVRRNEADGSYSKCTTTAKRGQLLVPEFGLGFGNITSRNVSVTQRTMQEQYLVVKSTIPVEALPPSIRRCAQDHRVSKPSIGFAYPIQSKEVPGKKHLMSTFTIGNTELPVHLHGEFILSPDRTTILMDKISSTSLETQYNEFLLGKLAPPAYLFLIHMCLKQGYPTFSLWPSHRYLATAEVLATETYNILHEFPGVLFETVSMDDTGARTYVSPADAVINHNDNLTLFLQKIGARNLVVNSRLSPRLVPSLQYDDSLWIKNLVLQVQSGNTLQDLFEDIYFRETSDFVGSLISHIVSSLGPESLNGLRLLPTTTTLHVFKKSQAVNKMFFVPSPEERGLFTFSEDRFIDHLSKSVIEIIVSPDVSLNVRRFVPKTDVGQIMAEGFPAAKNGFVSENDMRTNVNRIHGWMPRFKRYVTMYHVPVDELKPLPIIPLSHPEGTYISAESSSSLFPVDTTHLRGPLLHAVKALEGFHIISNWRDLPTGLISEPEPFNLSLFARWLGTHSWGSLDSKTQETLICEMTAQLQRSDSPKSVKHFNRLAQIPLWKCSSSDSSALVHKTAVDVVVLPALPRISLIKRYLDPNRHYASLTINNLRKAAKALGSTVLETCQSLSPFFSLPVRLEESDISSFEHLLDSILPQGGAWVSHITLAPDGNLFLRLARDLFDPRVDVFRNTLDASQLLHARFTLKAQSFVQHGLKSTIVPHTLEGCIEAVSQAVNDPSIGNIGERADILCRSLFATINPPEWYRIQGLSFIRRQNHESSPYWRRPYLLEMDLVVSPCQLVLQEYDRIAWTQRARFQMEPPTSLRERWPCLGKPSIGEVVLHLITLANEVATHVQDVVAHKNAFIQDLRETYEYLRDQVEGSDPESTSARLMLLDHSFDPIFLNVEHPHRPWKWTSAKSLVLDIDYDIPSQGLSHVNAFLIPYTGLLVAAGAKGITPANIAHLNVSDETPGTYAQILLTGLEKMRVKGFEENMTDVTLVATDPRGEDNGQLRAHKLVLAATSEWFAAKFSGNFQTTHTVELDVSLRTLQAIIDYFYGCEPIPERVPPGNEDQEVITYIQILLDILVAADELMLAALTKTVENRLLTGGGRFIRVTTAQDIIKYATVANSERIVEVCRRFIEKNASYFQAED